MEQPVPKAERRDAGAGVSAEQRLEFVEELTTREAPAAASAVLEWLARNAGVDRAVCAAVDSYRQRLGGLVGLGVPAEGVDAFHVDLGDKDHPLVLVLDGDKPVAFRESASRTWPPPETPLGKSSFLAVPLVADGQELAVGLLLLEPAAGDGIEEPEVEWAGGLLAARLGSILYQRLHDEREQQRTEREWLEGIFNAVSDPILLTDSEGRMLKANSAAESLLVAEDQASEGRRHAVTLNNMMFSASLTPGEAEGEADSREVFLVDPVDGSDLLFEHLTTSLSIGPGETATVSILRNVTDLHRAFEELENNYRKLRMAESETRAERDRLDLILSSVVDPVLVTNLEGDIVLMNPPAERLFTVGGEGDQEAEKRVRANDAVLSTFLSNLYASASGRWRGDIKLTDPESGKSVPMEATAGWVESKPGQDEVAVTILHDLSEAVEKAMLYEKVKRHSEELEAKVREATAELADQNELLRRQALQLEQASAMKSEFLANVSHELRTPLNAMLNYVSLFLEGVYGELNEMHREKLERLDSNARHLSSIIDDVLDISRIEAGKMPLEIEPFELDALLDEVISEYESMIEDSGLAVTCDVSSRVPELHTDRGKLKQIIINLLSNALKFTLEGSVAIRSTVDGEANDVVIEVEDTGVGISPSRQEKIFEAFGRTDSDAGKRGGTGLGLSICQRLSGVLGGGIELDSEEGTGSVFTLTIPADLRSE